MEPYVAELWSRLRRLPGVSPARIAGARPHGPPMDEETPQPRSLGLALSGGGGKGGAHLGVLAALEALEVPIDLIVGTSIGGAIGILYAAGYTPESLMRRFDEFSLRRTATADPSRTGLLGNRRREALFHALLGDRTFADLPIRCAVVTVDLISGETVVINEGPLVPAILATTALPALFPAVPYGDRLLVDGGVLNNLPTDVAESLGAQRVIAVHLTDCDEIFSLPEQTPSQPLARLMLAPLQFQVASRALALVMQQIADFQLEQHPPALLLSPDVASIPVLDMNRAADGFRAGAEAAQQADAELRALREWRMAIPAAAPEPAPARMPLRLPAIERRRRVEA